MRKAIPKWHMCSIATLALALTSMVPVVWAQEEEPEFSELRALIEINTTDGDAGFQILIDGDGWKEVKVDDPNGQKIYTVKGDKSVEEQGLTENFFESAEPECDEEGFSLADTLDRFPAGEYRVRGKSIDNEHFEGEAPLTHALPGAPDALLPVGAEVNPANPVMISWGLSDNLGNCPAGDADVEILGMDGLFGYQVVVAREVPEPLLEYIIEVPTGINSVTIPPEFLQENALYKYEVVAIENRDGERGNQSISEDFFCTTGGAPVNPCELPE